VYALSETVDGWYQTYYRGKPAYISASYGAIFSLEKTDNSKINKVLEEGYKLIGVPYVYGAVRLHDGNGNLLKGFTAQKFDCSSLVQYVFYKGAGVKLNTTTRTQIKQGKYVHPDKLQPGDCLFFTNEDRQYKTGIERVGHVAIYLGNNYILHTASDYACIEQISQKRWGFFIEARRFI
jgi:cell wall-associated NlpC family hydrolase